MDIQTLIKTLTTFLNEKIVPLIFILAFVFFIINVIRFFILGAGDKDARESAKRLALYGITALFIMTAIWGIVRLFSSILGVGIGTTPITPDYVQKNGGTNSGGNSNGNPTPCGSYANPCASDVTIPPSTGNSSNGGGNSAPCDSYKNPCDRDVLIFP